MARVPQTVGCSDQPDNRRGDTLTESVNEANANSRRNLELDYHEERA
jgi:hypothetical protein